MVKIKCLDKNIYFLPEDMYKMVTCHIGSAVYFDATILNIGKVYYCAIYFSSLIVGCDQYSTLARSITLSFNFPLLLGGCGKYSTLARSITVSFNFPLSMVGCGQYSTLARYITVTLNFPLTLVWHQSCL